MSSRIIFVSWAFLSLLLCSIFTGNLVASFMIIRNNGPISSLEELVNQSQYTWGTMDSISITAILQNSNSPILMKVWEGITGFQKHDPDVLSPIHAVHMKKVKSGSYAYIVDRLAINFADDCDIAISPGKFLPEHMSIGVQKGSPLRGPLSDQIMKLMENGLMDKWITTWLKKRTPCGADIMKKTASEGLQLVYLEAAFCLLLIGLGVASFALIGEILRKNNYHGAR